MALNKDKIKKVVLAYSGGLDTSVIIPWLKENYNNCEVIAVAGNVGQKDELEGLEAKALATGASKLYIEDLTEEFVNDFVFPAVKAGAAVTVRKTWSNSTLPSTMPPYVVPADLSSDYATIGNDLQTYVDEMYVKFVMGLESLDNFEAFRDQLRKMGVENYLSIAQTALDNYNAR